MAKAGKKHTPTNNPSKAGSSYWMLLKDAYPQLCKYFEPDEAVQRLLLMPIKKRYVKSGRERILSAAEIDLSVEIDATTGAGYLKIHDGEYFHPSVKPKPAEFLVPVAAVAREQQLGSGNNVASDYSPVEKFEQEEGLRPRTPPRLTPTAPTPTPKKKRRKAKQPSRAAALPSTAPAPAVSEVATQDVPREAQGIDPSNTGADGRPTAINPSTVSTVRKRRQSIKETRVIEVLRELDNECRVRDDMQPAEVEKIVMPRYRPRYGDVDRRTIFRGYKKFLKEPARNKSRQT
jgi:hypothetical protein